MARRKAAASRRRLSFFRLDHKGIPLSELIAVHRQFRAPAALAGNLGDGFLYAHNPVFRNVRDEYLRLGCSFTTEDVCDYFSFPLMALDEVIAAGKIPYRENFRWLVKIEKAAPGLFTLPTLKKSELQFNYLFHESAHFLAHRAFFGKRALARVAKSEATLLAIMVGEAFANTTECLSAVFAEGEIGSYFLDANCHYRANVEEVATLRRYARKYGFGPVARGLLGAFLYSNFLFEGLRPGERERLRELSGLPQAAAILPLARIGLELNETFRTTTTPLHLIKSGFLPSAVRRLRWDPVARLLKDQPLLSRTLALAESLVRGLDGI